MHSDALPATSQTCDGCSTLFSPKRPWQRFCKRTCRAAWHASQERPPVERLKDLERVAAQIKAANEELARRVGELEARVRPLVEPVR